LQQALLNENADAALKLSQKIITTQLNAVALGALNPLSGWNQNIGEVIESLINLQRELAKVGEVALTGGQLLAADFAEVIVDLNDPSFDIADAETKAFLASMKALSSGSVAGNAGGYDYVDDFMRREQSSGGFKNNPFQNAVVNVMLDANTLTGAVTSGQQNTTASGIVVGTSRINKIGG
jgi:hypothetical protein